MVMVSQWIMVQHSGSYDRTGNEGAAAGEIIKWRKERGMSGGVNYDLM